MSVSKDKTRSKNIPTSKITRSAIAGLAVTKIGLKHMGYKARQAISTAAASDQPQQDHEEKIGELIFTVLGQLRGTAVKLSQLLSMEADILPKTIRDKLHSACHQVPPINKALVRKQIVQELGDTPKQLFKEFNPQAFSAASIGQVHQAIAHDNTLLAVKVQYPGIGATIESDLKMVEKLFWLLSKTTDKFPKKQVVVLLMDEMQARLQEETNYEMEANNLNWFRQTVTLPGIVIPSVYEALSSRRVLSMDILTGQHLEDWLKTNPSQTQRNEVGQKLFDFFWYCVLQLKKINADPHPGNFLILADGQLGILDFGCVRSLSDDFIRDFSDMIPNIVDGYFFNKNTQSLLESYQKLKFIEQGVSLEVFESEIMPDLKLYGQWLGEAYVEKTFDFNNKKPCPGKPEDLSGSAIKFLSGMYSEQPCFDRAHLGLMNLLSQIGACINTDYLKFKIQ
jgi:predicted unusual protein kinase regulating ubiquinone biosynthesis (AarF/ABC1/UbiB family)